MATCRDAGISENIINNIYMINTIIKPNLKSKHDLDNILDSIYLLPQWEKIKEFSLFEKRFFFRRAFNVSLFRKFSSKNMLEKYSIRVGEENVIASMDLKVYKDSVYIINIDAYSLNSFEQTITKLVQVAVEKALYNTTDKEVKINLSLPLIKQNKMRRILLSLGFEAELEQSQYEKELFGETFSLKAENSVFWQKQIKQLSILINK